MFKPVDPHPNFAKLEEEVLKFWEKEKIFEKSLEQTRPSTDARGKKPFVFFDGPPFATGLPHYGHILASTIKDLVPRYQTMHGRFVRRRWGWDCHGLPIEEIVERQLKISGKKQIEKLGIKKFNETCRSKVLEYVEEWEKMVRRMGRWVDFENSYKTMDREYMESVWWAFKQFYDKSLVYQGRKVLLYCPRCETPVSNFEVAMDNSYETVTEEAVTVKFKIKNSTSPLIPPQAWGGSRRGERSPTFLLAWTTTPWTLPGNVALAVGKKITYVIFRISNIESGISEQNSTFHIPHSNYIVAKDRLSAIAENVEIIKELRGEDLVGLEYEPLFPLTLPSPARGEGGRRPGEGDWRNAYKVYAADFVNTEEGTGIVHTAVVYGEEDYELGQKVGLPVVPLLDEKGIFNDAAPKSLQGEYFKDAEKGIKADLEKRGLLFRREKHEHSYPHCWRCGTALYYNAIPAWFINIQKIKKKLLASNSKEISWYPEHLKHGRYEKSVEQAPDWNISRNRYWGNPIPIWRCEQCGKDTVIGSVEELAEKVAKTSPLSPPHEGGKGGSWNTLDLHRPYIDEVILKCDHCDGKARRITEIFDSWFEAASMPFAEYHYPFENKQVFESRYPAQFVAEYIAQTRAWFYVMHVVGLTLFGKAPFENVVTTGTILAEDGSKMSKSKNNYPDPWKAIDKYGVDSLRWYLMNSVVMQADNLNFSEADLGVVNRKVFRILYNIYNYFVTYANEAEWTPSSPARNDLHLAMSGGSPPYQGGEREGVLDQWQNSRLQQVIGQATNYFDNYDTVRATRVLEEFITDLSTWYLRRSRGRKDPEFFATLFHSLIYLTKLLAPVAPFLAEEIYQNLATPSSSPPYQGGEREGVISVHLAIWPKAEKLTSEQEELLKQMASLRGIVEQAHALRAKAGIKLRQPLQKLVIPKTPSSSSPYQGGEREGVLEILKDEVNVKEIVFGDKFELDLEIDEELKIEGLTRELERQINGLRKEMGMKIGQPADLYYDTESPILKKAIESVNRSKTYLAESRITNHESREESEKEIEIEGEKIKLWLKPVIRDT